MRLREGRADADSPGKADFRIESSPEVKLVGWQGSGDMAANARANCYAVLPAGCGGISAGDVITVFCGNTLETHDAYGA